MQRLEGGGHHRAVAARPVLAGKGIRLSRALASAGVVTRAVFPLSAADRAMLDVEDAEVCVDVPWAVRTNIVVTDEDGRTTNLNAQPHPLAPEEWERLSFAALRAAVDIDAGWLVIARSFPRIAGTDALIDIQPLVRASRGLEIRVAVDSSGAGLRSDAVAVAVAVAQVVRESGVDRAVNSPSSPIDGSTPWARARPDVPRRRDQTQSASSCRSVRTAR